MSTQASHHQTPPIASPDLSGSTPNLRLGDLKEVVLAGSQLAPLKDSQTDPIIGPWRTAIADIQLAAGTATRAWGLEAIEPFHGGVRVHVLLLPAPQPPVIQTAIGRVVIELRDGLGPPTSQIEPLEPVLAFL